MGGEAAGRPGWLSPNLPPRGNTNPNRRGQLTAEGYRGVEGEYLTTIFLRHVPTAPPAITAAYLFGLV